MAPEYFFGKFNFGIVFVESYRFSMALNSIVDRIHGT